MLTAERAREVFDYNPETGILTWKIRLISKSPDLVGKEAGCIVHNRYRILRIDGKKYYTHRVIYLMVIGAWPKNQIDHVDGIRDNNRWKNLRDATNKENSKNCKMFSTNVSGVSGVYWEKTLGRWGAKIGANGKNKYLGNFTDKQEAIKARKDAEIKFGYHENHGRRVG